MQNIFALIRVAHQQQTAAILPTLMLMSSIMVISGVAFLSVTSYEAKTVYDATASIQAKYNAEAAVRKALWRIEQAPQSLWSSVATFTDSGYTAIFDTTTFTVMGVGFYGGITDTVEASVAIDSLDTEAQLGHIILYKKHLSIGDGVILNHAPENGPRRIRGWWRKWRIRHRLFNHHVYPDMRAFFQRTTTIYSRDMLSSMTVNVDFLTAYDRHSIFDGPMSDGVHFIRGNVTLKNGTTLNGSIFATGSITMESGVTINAQQVPVNSPRYPAYFPALVAMRGSDTEQMEVSDLDDMDGMSTNIAGLIFSRRGVRFTGNTNITGLIIARSVKLDGNTTVTYDSKYRTRPPQLFIDTRFRPRVWRWIWRGWRKYLAG